MGELCAQPPGVRSVFRPAGLPARCLRNRSCRERAKGRVCCARWCYLAGTGVLRPAPSATGRPAGTRVLAAIPGEAAAVMVRLEFSSLTASAMAVGAARQRQGRAAGQQVHVGLLFHMFQGDTWRCAAEGRNTTYGQHGVVFVVLRVGCGAAGVRGIAYVPMLSMACERRSVGGDQPLHGVAGSAPPPWPPAHGRCRRRSSRAEIRPPTCLGRAPVALVRKSAGSWVMS